MISTVRRKASADKLWVVYFVFVTHTRPKECAQQPVFPQDFLLVQRAKKSTTYTASALRGPQP